MSKIRQYVHLYSNICDVDTLCKNKLLQASPFHSCQPLKYQNAMSQKP